MGYRVWKWAVGIGALGLVLMVCAILVADRWENMFGVAVLVGMVCMGAALLLLAAAWVMALWQSFRQKAYIQMLLWLLAGAAVVVPACLRLGA